MRGRWRFVLWVACGALLGLWGGGFTGVSPSVPPEVSEVLPYGVILWHWRPLSPQVGTAPLTALAVGDLTGDGHDDVVVSNYQAIYVFAGQADGTFATRTVGFYEVTWHDGRYYTVTGSVVPLFGALADLDGDDAMDLVVATGGSRPALHLFRNGGRGGLDKQASLSVSSTPYRLWLVDITGNGILDIVWWTTNVEDVGTWYLHEGRGSFEFADPVPVASAQGRPFAMRDLDGDGLLDLALYRSQGLLVLWGGPGGFTEELEWVSPYGEVHHAASNDSVLGGVDVVLATSQGLVTGTVSRDGFKVTKFLPTGLLSWVHLMDLTGDGVEDALVRARKGWTVLPGKGNGAFHQPTSEFLLFGSLSLGIRQVFWPMMLAGQPALVVGNEPFPIVYGIGGKPRGESFIPFDGSYLLAAGDLSGNGAPDLVVEGAQGLDVLWNNGSGGFVRRPILTELVHVVSAVVKEKNLYFLNLAERAGGWLATELWTVSSHGEVLSREVLEEFGPDQANEVQPVLAVADFDRDGNPDVLALKQNGILVKWAGGTWTSYPWTAGNLGLAVCGQFTRTDLPEVALVSDAGVHYVAFPGRSLEAKQALFQLDQFPLNVAYGDVDSDGLDDVALLTLGIELELEGEELKVTLEGVQGWVLRSSGEVVALDLPQLGEEDVSWPLRGLAIGDFTGDGKNDVAFTTIRGAGAFVLPGRGGGAFDQWLRIPRAMGPILAADLDGNGNLELVGSTLGFNPCLWIRWGGGER